MMEQSPLYDLRYQAECYSCEEGLDMDECQSSMKPCGHHCNHVWTHDVCDWCDWHYEEE